MGTSTAAAIKAARRAKFWRQTDLASATGVSVTAVRAWEAGARPRFPMLQRIATALDIEVAELNGTADAPGAPVPDGDLDALLLTFTLQLSEHLRIPIDRVKLDVKISGPPQIVTAGRGDDPAAADEQ